MEATAEAEAGTSVTTRAEMNHRKEQVWETLHQRGPSKASEVKFQLAGSWQDVAGGWTQAKVGVALQALFLEGRVDKWGQPWGIGQVWITVPVEVPTDLIDQIESIADDAPFIRWVERASHDDHFRRNTDPPV